MIWQEEQSKYTPKDWFYCDANGKVLARVLNRGAHRCWAYEAAGPSGTALLIGQYVDLTSAKRAVEEKFPVARMDSRGAR